MIPLLFVVGCGMLGAAVLALGLRGRRINDHPHCRRCRFDLSGLDVNAADAKCPECGAGLNGERAVRVGMRSARRGVAGLGGFLVLIALLGAGGVVYMQATGVNWDRIVPAGALVSQIPRADDEREAVLLAELARRIENDAMPDNALARAAAMAIERQQDLSLMWNDTWGDLIGAAWRRGLLSDEQMISALEGTIGVDLSVRDRVRFGDRVSLGLRYERSARPARSIPAVEVRVTTGSVRMDGAPVEFSSQQGAPHGLYSMVLGQHDPSIVGFTAVGPNGMVPPPESPGRRTFTAELRFRMYGEGQIPGQPGHHSRDLENAGDPILEWARPVSASTMVLGPGEETIALVVDDDLRVSVAESLSARDASTEPNLRGGRTLHITITVTKRPVYVSFAAWCRRAGGEEIRLGHVHAPPADERFSYSFVKRERVGDDFLDETVDIILRPDREIIRSYQDVEEIWGEEVIIRGVRVERSDGEDSDAK